MIDKPNIISLVSKGNELIAMKILVMDGHCIRESADDCFGNIYDTKSDSVIAEERDPRTLVLRLIRTGEPGD